MPLNIVLYQPEIPQNTGNIMRLCANTSHKLHLIEPLGFILNDKYLKRSGMDYIKNTWYKTYSSFDELLQINNFDKTRIFLLTTKSNEVYSDVQFLANDVLVFGPETRGLPDNLLSSYHKITIPMVDTGRSLNLANSVSIVAYEAWRQLEFKS
ncbi:MAG: tRNA (cytidine(34)-2'-O)-methyltransferase [Francisellaceae bacterium]|jgi:tRNA (cytidine/uridine-2'-O-)-methyltransferase|nr:tRNA (cytidine(34)-2'-O)-methyltransferase [Francisellaceae bacterium]MBT6207050.1 tRNA (cytidine(34)-2'-O)-methyltransferase [Francisellaceae bacterium]MBT6538455.1 tRNA (cytidine(34)-2'-O)-methyltransferase [Francisellaceae bacterium]